jgi:superoxide reductase
MNGRREFLLGTLAVGAAVAVGRPGTALGAGTAFPPFVYTKENPGRWAGKEGAHAPKVTAEGGKVTILTPHPMTPAHFIVKHTLLTPEGKVLGEKTFTASDAKAESSHELPAGFKGALWATSFCNLHDLWLAELAV